MTNKKIHALTRETDRQIRALNQGTDKHIRDLNRETERQASGGTFIATVLMILTLAAMLFMGVIRFFHH